MAPLYDFERKDECGAVQRREHYFALEDMPHYGDEVEIDGQRWTRVMERRPATAKIPGVTVAHSRPRKGDPRDPGAPAYDHRNRAILKNRAEKDDYAKRYNDKNEDQIRFEHSGSEGAYGDER